MQFIAVVSGSIYWLYLVYMKVGFVLQQVNVMSIAGLVCCSIL